MTREEKLEAYASTLNKWLLDLGKNHLGFIEIVESNVTNANLQKDIAEYKTILIDTLKNIKEGAMAFDESK